MTTELQNKAWSCLPKEFKEEVKELYDSGIKMMDIRPSASEIYANKLSTLEGIFGHHNLTSDAEGEEDEMLYVSRKQIDALQGEIFKAIMDAHDADDWQDAAHYILDVMPRSFAALFGSKCLPDEPASKVENEDSKPAEPKFHVGQKVKFKGKDNGFEITAIEKWSDCDEYKYKLAGWKHSYRESDLEPYTEPEEDVNLSQNIVDCDKQFDTILKDSFRNERRLNIATQITASFYSNDKVTSWFHSIEALVRKALDIADTLIAECEKKGDHDGED